MVVRVKLKGLKIARNKAGNYFVYIRGTRKTVLKNFNGDRDALLVRLGEPDVLTLYNAYRKRDLARVYADGTLGSLVTWFQKECPAYGKLADSSRADYDKAFEWLLPAFDCTLDLITTPELYDLRDRCSKEKWPRFAEKMISALSSMFGHAVERRRMLANPCLGMKKAHKADPNANREWLPAEWTFVRANAPMEVLIPCMIARYVGLAGQTIVGLNERQFLDDPEGPTGRAVQYTRRKNGKTTFLPVLPELQSFMTERKVRSAEGLIAIRDNGSSWDSEKDTDPREPLAARPRA